MGLPAGTGPNNVGTSNLAGMTLPPGIYTSSTTMLVSGGALVLDAGGDSTAVFVFQVGSSLTVDSGGSIQLVNGAMADNVYWCEGTSATIGLGSAFNGHLLAGSAVTLVQDAAVTGRIFSDTTSISLDSNVVQCGGP